MKRELAENASSLFFIQKDKPYKILAKYNLSILYAFY
jgi:hypothetical protein